MNEKDKGNIEELGKVGQMLATKEKIQRDDSDLEGLDPDNIKEIKDVRNRTEGIIKELLEFLHHPRFYPELIDRLDFELTGAKNAQWLKKV